MTFPEKLGLDLDNTVIDYGPAIPIVARSLGLGADLRDRESIRAALKTASDDWEWQRFQSVLYTDGLQHAVLAPGLLAFLDLCRERSVALTIVSHKTAFTPSKLGGMSLREPATAWLTREGISPKYAEMDSVFYCSTREEKLKTIAELDLDVFVDDLPEVLADPQMPARVVCFLYEAPDASAVTAANIGGGLEGIDFAGLTAWLEQC